MVSLITAPNRLLLPPRFIGDLNFHSISLPLVVVIGPRICRRQQRPPPVVNSESRSLGFGVLKRKHYEGFSFCSCKGRESEGDLALEAEILEFMTKSEKPEVFPTKEELIDAGRMDLVEAIARNGGWLSLGWDLDDGNEKVKVEENRFARNCDDERAKVQESVGVDRDCDNEAVEVGRFRVSSVSIDNATQSPSSSGRSLELGDEEEIGIEGIVSRLEKQRNLSFGIDWGKNGHSSPVLSEYGEDSHVGTSRVADSTDLGRSSRLASGIPKNGMINNSGGKFSPKESVLDFDGSKDSLKPEMWRTWSLQRAGFLGAEFEAGEVYLDVDKMHEAKDASKEEILARTEDSTEPLDIRTRLQHLELELASALCLLRSKSEESVSNEGHEFSSNDLWKLSDAWEFQENEIMNAQDRLRSIRAKLAVLEGKMALAIIDAQKILEGKQKRIDGARRALQLLRTTCVVWHNSASEVLLAGSYDGWTTQKKMEKSKTGIFSVCLKLYPGRYEIKFIVDGVWRTDPLRPIVNNSGYDNNLLIIT